MLKKQLIMDTAIELFAQKGIDATSIQQITEKCGISKGAFYLSFKSKDELIISIIDYFMKNITSQIEWSVSKQNNAQDKLHAYYYEIFLMMENYGDFANVFLKEQPQFFHESFIEKMTYYENLSNTLLLEITKMLNPDINEELQYDLLFIIRGFITSYADFIFKRYVDYDLNSLVESLVEKTIIIATQSQKSFLTKDMLPQRPHYSLNVTNEMLLNEIEHLLQYSTDEILTDSLLILEEQIKSDNPKKAIILGMISNLKDEPSCNWFCYLMRKWYQN